MSTDKETVRFSARAWLDTAKKSKLGKGDAAKWQTLRLAAINLMIADGSTREVIEYVNFILGQPLMREWGDGGDAQRARGRAAAAKFEAEYYARAYREKNLDPSKEQHIKPADVSEVARVYAAEVGKSVDACRSQIRKLRDRDDYQTEVGSFLLEMVKPLPTGT
ncbi:MAG: hypothetical protein AB7S71_18190 [Dongiaceae bacterium]